MCLYCEQREREDEIASERIYFALYYSGVVVYRPSFRVIYRWHIPGRQVTCDTMALSLENNVHATVT